MTLIATKRHPLKFYAALIFAFLFFMALGSFGLDVSIELIQTEQKGYMLSAMAVATYFVAFYTIYAYFRNVPNVTIDFDTMAIGKKRYRLKDIKDIALGGKMPFPYIIKHPMEGIAILFNDGTERFLFDDMYTNLHEIKLYLQQVYIDKQEYKPIRLYDVGKNEISFQDKQTFKGSQFTSSRGLFLWGMVGGLGYILLAKKTDSQLGTWITLTAVAVMWFIISSWLMFYFFLTKDFLIVKNHNFIWIKKTYRLTDIREVVFEAASQQPNSMRIISKDFKSNVYRAGTLRNKNWLEMKRQLELKGVKVRNECIIEGVV